MQWTEAIHQHIESLQPVTINAALKERIFSLIDLTSLNAEDNANSIVQLCSKARGPLGHVAAICIYPSFVRMVATEFAGSAIKTATVVNFPEGTASLETVLIDINSALTNGAQEIDVVLPYNRYLAGERQYTQNFVSACKAACGADALLKVILETGALSDPAIIADACYDVIASGADFVKTSTGKFSEGATLEAAATILLVIKHVLPQLSHRVGCKVSGGIRSIEQATQYIALADEILGKDWVEPDTFRIGASKLVDELLGN